MLLSTALKAFSFCAGYHISANKGFVIAPHSVRRCIRVSQEEKLVLFEIYAFYNDKLGCAFPTQETLAMCVGTSSGTVSKHLQSLEEKGFIKSKGRKGKTKNYYPNFDLKDNIYITMSEYFHFAVKRLRTHVRDVAGAGWGDHLLKYVNIPKKDEWTPKNAWPMENDPYGNLLRELSHCDPTDYESKWRVAENLFQDLQLRVEEYTSEKLEIEWSREFARYCSTEYSVEVESEYEKYLEVQTRKEEEKAEKMKHTEQSTPQYIDNDLGGWSE